VTIDLQLKLVNATRWGLRVIPKAKCAQCHGLLEEQDNTVGLTLRRGIFFGCSRTRMTLRVFVGREPDMVVTSCAVLAIDEIRAVADVITHTIECVNASWVCIDLELISFRLAHVVAVLVI